MQRTFLRGGAGRGVWNRREPKSGTKPFFVAAVGPATSEAAAAEGFMVGHMAEEFQGVELAPNWAQNYLARRCCCLEATRRAKICPRPCARPERM